METLTKALEIARANGWRDAFYDHQSGGGLMFDDTWYGVVFNHDFAKALWGDENVYLDVEAINPEIGGHYDQYEQPPLPAYKKHLAQMVISEDPIKYLGEHLPQ